MSEKVEMALVQGTVEFKINCNELVGLVTPEIANDEERLKNWLTDKAFKMIESASEEVEIDNDIKVFISKKTADEYRNEIIDKDDWKKIREEDKE